VIGFAETRTKPVRPVALALEVTFRRSSAGLRVKEGARKTWSLTHLESAPDPIGLKMKAMWRFAIDESDIVELRMPSGAIPRCFDVQDGEPILYVEVEDTNPVVVRRFRVFSTGHCIDSVGDYIGTVQLKGGSLHIYDAID
jgi:hypothetical protein